MVRLRGLETVDADITAASINPRQSDSGGLGLSGVLLALGGHGQGAICLRCVSGQITGGADLGARLQGGGAGHAPVNGGAVRAASTSHSSGKLLSGPLGNRGDARVMLTSLMVPVASAYTAKGKA